jgi:hypothetical protein
MPKRTATWTDCCTEAVQQMKETGLTTIINERSVGNWNIQFRKSEVFHHSNAFVESGKQPTPLLFVHYPECKQEIEQWCLENLAMLSCEQLANHIHSTVLPHVYQKYEKDYARRSSSSSMDDDDSSDGSDKEDDSPRAPPPPPAHDEDKLMYDEFLYTNFRIKKFEASTAHNWLTVYLQFKYSELTASYYTDRHENQENKDDRGIFSPTHFEYERCAHRWIQITADEAKNLEEEEQDDKKKRRLLKHIAHEYIVVKPDSTVIEMREYHVDSHPAFATYVLEENQKFGGNLSVRKKEHECPVLIIGQDESIY